MISSKLPLWALERRELPILPSNKLYLRYRPGKQKKSMPLHALDRPEGNRTTNIILLRMGEAKQGVINLFAEGTQKFPIVKVDFMGIDDTSVASYLMTMYVGMAVTTPGSLAVAKVIV